jgi:hypothetical protein
MLFTRRILACCGLLLLLVLPAAAQFKAAIQGTVTDASGAAVPNAKVTLTSTETHREQVTQSSGDGVYRFDGLAPGSYSVAVEAAGFKKETSENIQVLAEQTQGVNISLSPGQVTESVTVSADSAQAIQTENANVGGTLTTDQVERLPQIGRDPYELIRLTPGVFGLGARDGSGNSIGLPNTTGPGGSNTSIFQTENQVPISANGQRLSDNNFMIDGVTVNSQNWGGAAVVTPNQESVKQITVHSEAYDAEYGRNSGAQIETVSKNGTDQFHGSGFFQFQDPNFNAYNKYGGPFDAPPVRVDTRFRQYGGSVGGPVVKDKLFFFFSYEGLTNTTNTPYENWVETPQYRQAVINAYPNSIAAKAFSSPGIAPPVIAVLNVPCSSSFAPGTCQQVSGGLNIGSIAGGTGKYVDISKDPTGGGLNGVPDVQYDVLGAPSLQRGNQYNFRGDYTHGGDSFAFSTYLTPLSGTQAQTASQSRPMADLPNNPFSSAYFVSFSHVFSPTVFNQARANFTRFADNQIAGSSEVNWGIPELQIQNIPGVNNNIQFGAPQGSTTPAIFAQNTYEFNDTLNKMLGRHALKFGVVIRKLQNNDNLAGGARPVYTFQGPWNFANDAPIYEAINANPETGAPAPAQHYLRNGDYGLFVQDDFKLRPNLTINLGLRWEYFSPLSDKNGQISNVFFGPGDNYNTSYIKVGGQLYNPDYKNFAPRIGFAWSPKMANNKLVVRGGYGWFYNQIPGVVFENVFQDPPYFGSYGICCGTATTSFGTPFANGQILYALGSSNSPFSYPVNPALATGIDPTTNAPRGPSNPNAPQVQVYMAQQNMPNPFVQVYSFDLQYQLPWKLIATAGYSGSEARHQIRLVNESFLYPTGPLFPFTQVYDPQPDVNSNFNALLMSLSRRFANGFQFSANYRWSKSLDTLSYEGPGSVTNQTYPQNQATEYGPSDYDVPQYFNLSSLYNLPTFHKQQGFLGHLLSGFNISGIFTTSSGFPWTPVTCGASEATPGGQTLCPIRPIAYLGDAGHSTSNSAYIDGSNFPNGGKSYFVITSPTSGPTTLPPGIGRNSWRGPGFLSTDMSIGKTTSLSGLHLGEAAKLDLRANFYNIFNKLNLQPISFGSANSTIENQDFGLSPGGTAGRVVELLARFSF